ncbi:GntP family permease (plasmid) [Halococcus dombrowskii]|uniref:GntP family permease n=1 Tax=Halococcus dombrowskii TaxID=179637 RepID=A0AAV3SL81_HALDO|nr:gluconate:H+ symporter [Halococcus dombrowskii]UOO96667.1 GntP family permease [Halococcus dombrowskii]
MNSLLQFGPVNPAVVAFIAGVIVVVVLLVRLKVPPFIGLLVASFIVALLTPQIQLGKTASMIASSFGDTMTEIGIPILMAAVIGKSLTKSNSANRILEAFTGITGRKRIEWALFASGFVLAIPVFFDNVFYLLIPLAWAASTRLDGRNYALFVVMIGAGAGAANRYVPPTPAPLTATNILGVDVGTTILVGSAIAIPTAIVVGAGYGYFINERIEIPLRDSSFLADLDADKDTRNAEQTPGLFEAFLPIILAVVLVASQTASSTFFGQNQTLTAVTNFIGNPNFSLTIAAIVASITYFRIADIDLEEWSDELTDSLKTGGNIAAITAAGSAFGAVLAASGIGNVIASTLSELGLGLLVTAWVIAAAVRVVQGSATVAVLTTAQIVQPLMGQLTVNPVYLTLVIGTGGAIFSWYNDSGFWIVSEIGGLTQKETLQTWTVVTTLSSIIGLIVILVLANLFPLT